MLCVRVWGLAMFSSTLRHNRGPAGAGLVLLEVDLHLRASRATSRRRDSVASDRRCSSPPPNCAQQVGLAAGDDVSMAPHGSHSTCAQLRSEEHTSEIPSHFNIVFPLLLEKKKKTTVIIETSQTFCTVSNNHMSD